MSAGLDDARLAVLVHEVRSPVAALAAVAEAIAGSSHDAPGVRELARLSIAACRAIERLVLDAAVASVRAERIDVGALVRDAAAAHLVRGAAIVVRADDGLMVDGDLVRLRQAFDNLVANALVHGGPDAVDVRVDGSDAAVRIVVSDGGPGIPEDDQARIFDIGARLADDRPGSGLGLPLARAIVEAHGGTLDVASTGGGGATFTIVLPVRLAHPDTAASTS